jgi:hypothetical protein
MNIIAPAIIAALFVAVPAFGQVVREASSSPSQSYEITVYNSNLGLVKDLRNVDLDTGLNKLRISDVAAQIDPTSVHMKSITDPTGLTALEQNYQYDLVDNNKLLSKYLGKKIKIKNWVQNEEITTEGTLLSASGGIVLQAEDRIILNPQGTVELSELPEGLIVRPTLDWLIDSAKSGEQKIELSYLTQGINWVCNYVTVVNQDDTKIDLTGWVTIDNRSGATYKNAGLKLIAGDIHRVQPPVYPERMMEAKAAGVAAAPQFEEKPFFEYHMYTLGRRTTIADNETKQMTLLQAADVPAKKVYIFDPGQRYWSGGDSSEAKKVNVKMEFKNSADQNLGMPLPKGKIRVYKADTDGSLQFVGEDEIDHTPKDETIRIYVGDAFDLVGERTVTNYKQISDRVREETVEIKLRNHKAEDVEITAVEHFWADWEILEKTHDYNKKDAHTAEFTVKVPKDGETVITYTVRTTW